MASYPKHCQAPKQLTAPLKYGERKVFLTPAQQDYAVLLQRLVDPNGKMSNPEESEEREKRDKGMGVFPCTQLPGKLGSYTRLL